MYKKRISTTKVLCIAIALTLFLAASCEQPHAHSWNAEITSLPTCTEEGVITYTCAGCNTTREEKVPATGHAEPTHIITKAPTCTAEGTFEDKCSVCGEVLKTGAVEKTAHKPFPIEIITEATCTEDGVAVCVCRDCMAELGTTTYPKKGHVAAETVVVGTKPTCTENGTNHILCKVCGANMEDVVVEKLGHAWGETVIVKAATCSEEGLAERTCSRCGEKNNGKIACIPHTWDGNIVRDVEPDCKNDGKGHISCTKCDAIQTIVFPATGEHNLVQNGEDTPATEYTRPIAHKICTVCGEKVDEPYGEPLGHIHQTAETITVPATCSSVGKTVQYCSCYIDEEGTIYPEAGEGRTRYIISQSLLGTDPNNHSYGEEQLKGRGFTHGDVSYKYCPECQKYTGKVYGNAAPFAGKWNFTGAFTGYLSIASGYGEDAQVDQPIDFNTYGSVDVFSGTCSIMINELGGQVAPGTWESKVRFENGEEIDELRIRVQTGLDTYEVYILRIGEQNVSTKELTASIMTITGHPVINIALEE